MCPNPIIGDNYVARFLCLYPLHYLSAHIVVICLDASTNVLGPMCVDTFNGLTGCMDYDCPASSLFHARVQRDGWDKEWDSFVESYGKTSRTSSVGLEVEVDPLSAPRQPYLPPSSFRLCRSLLRRLSRLLRQRPQEYFPLQVYRF